MSGAEPIKPAALGASAAAAASPSLLRAWLALWRLSAWRMGWTLQSLAAAALLILLAVVTLGVTLFARQSGQFQWDVTNFSRAIVDGVYLRFILPMLCLCYGTQALGGEWEERNLVWLLTRPIPRPLAYLAKWLAALPWCVGFALAGLFLVGGLAGEPGLKSAAAYWPVMVSGAAAYSALFVLLGAWFRRSTIIGVAYCFVLETIFSFMPGLVKRVGLSFYTRCQLYGIAKEQGWDLIDGKPAVTPDRIAFFMPVDGETARWALAGAAFGLVLFGMFLFARKEYRDLS